MKRPRSGAMSLRLSTTVAPEPLLTRWRVSIPSLDYHISISEVAYEACWDLHEGYLLLSDKLLEDIYVNYFYTCTHRYLMKREIYSKKVPDCSQSAISL